MKEIDVEKVRSAILSLQANGKHEFASIVWDLLDNYVSQKPQPIEFLRQSVEDRAERRGASAFAGLPKCQVTRYMGGVPRCTDPAVGHLNTQKGNSYLMCAAHGKAMDLTDGADWVQTFFGDENTAADVAEYQARMTL